MQPELLQQETTDSKYLSPFELWMIVFHFGTWSKAPSTAHSVLVTLP